MPKRKPIRANPSREGEPRVQGAAPDLDNSCRNARLEALRRVMEFRERAWAMSQLLGERILELLRLPAVKTISRPGQEPRDVFVNSGFETALPSLIQTYRLLTKTALEPLPADSALTAALAESARVRVGGEANQAAQKPAPEATVPDPSRATKCNVFQRKRAPLDEKPDIKKCA